MVQAFRLQQGGVAGRDVDCKGVVAHAVEAVALVPVRVGEHHVLHLADADFVQMFEPLPRAEVDGKGPVAVAQDVDIAGIGNTEEVPIELVPDLVFLHAPSPRVRVWKIHNTDCGGGNQGTLRELTVFLLEDIF